MGRLANEAALEKILNDIYCQESFDDSIEKTTRSVDSYLDSQSSNNAKTAATFLLKNLDQLQ